MHDRSPHIVAWTINHSGNDLTDHWSIHPDADSARDAYDAILVADDLHCVCYGPMLLASEPQWLEPGGV